MIMPWPLTRKWVTVHILLAASKTNFMHIGRVHLAIPLDIDQGSLSPQPIRESHLPDNYRVGLCGGGSKQHCGGRADSQVFHVFSVSLSRTNSFVDGSVCYWLTSSGFPLWNLYIVSIISATCRWLASSHPDIVLVLLRAWAVCGCQRRAAIMLISSYLIYLLIYLLTAAFQLDLMTITCRSNQFLLPGISSVSLFASSHVPVCKSPWDLCKSNGAYVS